MLRKSLKKYGPIKLTIFFTLASILLSLLITVLVNLLFTNEPVGFSGIFIAIIVPALIAPTFSSIQLSLLSQLFTTEEKLQTLAITDELTQTYNRRYFIHCAEEVIEQTKQTGGTFTIIILDMDNFKEINDTYGHLAGDQILRQFSMTCKAALTDSVLFARYGGDEFVLLLSNANPEEVSQYITVIRNTVENTYLEVDNKRLSITASIGSATFSPELRDLDILLAQADQAMYLEKRSKGKAIAG